MDPLTISGAIAGIKIANEAFGAIKELIANGRSVTDAGSQLARWFAGASAIEREANDRTSPVGDNASARAIEVLTARNQIRRQRDELRQWLQLYGPSGSWNEFIALEREFRLQAKKEKEDAAAARAKRLKKFKDILTAGLIVLFFTMLIGIALVVYLNIRKAEATYGPKEIAAGQHHEHFGP